MLHDSVGIRAKPSGPMVGSPKVEALCDDREMVVDESWEGGRMEAGEPKELLGVPSEKTAGWYMYVR